MKNDIRYATRLLTLFLFLVFVTFSTVSGQSPAGILKIFSDTPVVVFVDEIHYPQYGEIKLVPGTHWVKGINGEGIKVYSQIVTVKAGEVTSVLIEASSDQAVHLQPGPAQPAQTRPSGTSQAVVYGQAPSGDQTGRPSANSQSGEPDNKLTDEPGVAAAPKQTIDIGQVGGRLPADMSGAFGLSFGMSMRDADQVMSQKAAQAQRNSGYSVYAIPQGSSVYLVECRFIDQKLFQIIVGYVSTTAVNEKLKLSKGEVPVPEFNQMLNDVTAIYGSPASVEKIFLSGYSEDDGRLLEALKKKKALMLYTWTDPVTGNYVLVGLGYTTAPLAATIYTSGPMSAEAAARKLKLHAYEYHKTFKDNYFSN